MVPDQLSYGTLHATGGLGMRPTDVPHRDVTHDGPHTSRGGIMRHLSLFGVGTVLLVVLAIVLITRAPTTHSAPSRDCPGGMTSAVGGAIGGPDHHC